MSFDSSTASPLLGTPLTRCKVIKQTHTHSHFIPSPSLPPPNHPESHSHTPQPLCCFTTFSGPTAPRNAWRASPTPTTFSHSRDFTAACGDVRGRSSRLALPWPCSAGCGAITRRASEPFCLCTPRPPLALPCPSLSCFICFHYTPRRSVSLQSYFGMGRVFVRAMCMRQSPRPLNVEAVFARLCAAPLKS